MSTTARVLEVPQCDVQGCMKTAVYDAKTVKGPWAYLCERHYRLLRLHPKLGAGKGQRLVKETP